MAGIWDLLAAYMAYRGSKPQNPDSFTPVTTPNEDTLFGQIQAMLNYDPSRSYGSEYADQFLQGIGKPGGPGGYTPKYASPLMAGQTVPTAPKIDFNQYMPKYWRADYTGPRYGDAKPNVPGQGLFGGAGGGATPGNTGAADQPKDPNYGGKPGGGPNEGSPPAWAANGNPSGTGGMAPWGANGIGHPNGLPATPQEAGYSDSSHPAETATVWAKIRELGWAAAEALFVGDPLTRWIFKKLYDHFHPKKPDPAANYTGGGSGQAPGPPGGGATAPSNPTGPMGVFGGPGSFFGPAPGGVISHDGGTYVDPQTGAVRPVKG